MATSRSLLQGIYALLPICAFVLGLTMLVIASVKVGQAVIEAIQASANPRASMASSPSSSVPAPNAFPLNLR
jgi:uncharacterized membrane-anchored protein